MSYRIDEDLAWMRVKDLQREVENRRLMRGAPPSRAASALRRIIARAIVGAGLRRAVRPAARPAVGTQHLETQHHA